MANCNLSSALNTGMAAINLPTNPDEGDTYTNGDLEFRYDGTVWRRVPGIASIPYRMSGGAQCRFHYVSATQCKLAPFNGNRIPINGSIEEIPSAGVTLSNSGLSSGTVYYVYAYMNGTTMTLEASTTAPADDATRRNEGVRIKGQDPTRTLVGMVLLAPVSNVVSFHDSTGNRYVISWFNRRRIMTRAVSSTYITFTHIFDDSASNDGFGSILGPASWLDWGIEPPIFSMIGVITESGTDSSDDICYIRILLDNSHPTSVRTLFQQHVGGHRGRHYNFSQRGNPFGDVMTAGNHNIRLYACKTSTHAVKFTGAHSDLGPMIGVEFQG